MEKALLRSRQIFKFGLLRKKGNKKNLKIRLVFNQMVVAFFPPYYSYTIPLASIKQNRILMKKNILLLTTILIFTIACNDQKKTVDPSSDINEIKKLINDSDKGWDSKNLDLVLKGYSDDIDWTNAFGDRRQGKEELRDLLDTIFGLDFVMAGKNNYQEPDITFPSEEIALARSKNIRTEQQWPDGSPMDDRIINHLRVFKKVDGKWICINHMISQAHNKRKE